MRYIHITPDRLPTEHICCAISDKKCAEGYALKQQWLAAEHAKGYVFSRLDARAKVFIEYGPAEEAWVPVTAPGHLMLGCFWVSGQYKGQGHGKALLNEALEAARQQHKEGLLAVVGQTKFHFMSDTAWLKRQGFVEVDQTPAGFSLLALNLKKTKSKPRFNDAARTGQGIPPKGLVAYYSNRCPFTEYHLNESLPETASRRQLPLKVVKLSTREQAQAAPTPATIFSLFLDGRFLTTDLSACMDSRFDKVAGRLR